MRSRQLYASITASTAGTVFFDVPNDTTIRAVTWAIFCSAAAVGDQIYCEISASGTNQTAVSDAQGIISIASAGNGAITGTALPVLATNFYTNCQYGIKSGERIYLNATETGGSTWIVRAIVWFD